MDHSGYGLSKWETTLHCNVVSHWLSPHPEWSIGNTQHNYNKTAHNKVVCISWWRHQMEISSALLALCAGNSPPWLWRVESGTVMNVLLKHSTTSLVLYVFHCFDVACVYHHDDFIKWKNFPCYAYWPFVRGIHRPPVNSPHKGQWRGALLFSFICAWMKCWVNNREAGDLRRHRAHYDVTIMLW